MPRDEVEELVLETIPGELPLQDARKICVFAHFDHQAHIGKYIPIYLEELRRCGFKIIFVSAGGEHLNAEELKTVLPHVICVIRKKNQGYDFIGHKIAIRRLGHLSNYDHLILVNDSVYGPFQTLEPFFRRMEEERAEFWGASDNLEHGWHIQSYFMGFSGQLLKDGALEYFLEGYPILSDRKQVILQAELGLSNFLRDKYRTNSFVRYTDIVNRAREMGMHGEWEKKPVNLIMKFWPFIRNEFGFPFAKRDFLYKIEYGITPLIPWRDILAGNSGYDCRLIEEHLRRWRDYKLKAKAEQGK